MPSIHHYCSQGAEDYWHARTWLREAYERFHPDARQVGFVDKASLLEYLAWSEYKVLALCYAQLL